MNSAQRSASVVSVAVQLLDMTVNILSQLNTAVLHKSHLWMQNHTKHTDELKRH